MNNNLVGIICPIFNDWDSFYRLVRDLDLTMAGSGWRLKIIGVDDGSYQTPDPTQWQQGQFSAVEAIQLVHLVTNLGHQRAIAIGLVEASRDPELDVIIVMDADGEDRPQDIPDLLATHRTAPDDIIVVKRGKRSETALFRISYIFYKLFFYLMSGRVIDFGNFCLIPRARLSNIIFKSDVWNHLAASVLRCGVPIRKLVAKRGQRYCGRSQMNFASLMILGLSATSVYIDLFAARVLALIIVCATGSLLGLAGIFVIKEFTDLAIPGWATNVFGFILLILLQTFTLLVTLTLFVLHSRSTKTHVPAVDAELYIGRRSMPVCRTL